ncbi:MAG: thioredoxin [Candidatus Marinimicrobia bacterium]|nr:thioredoxin [Candidatus Neomarinimicrobiota bacterium]MCK9483999.1 thioredoxin [Candidatus Neomarinimicrobiota bacterium]MDD5540882.1 thioredoxin [Candidatus Neomarinimicrobiota bacterium]
MIEFTQSNFSEEVEQQTSVPVLVDFWATWCVPCLKIAPVLEELAQKYDGKMKFGKVNVESAPAIAQKFGVRSIPTLLIFKNGKIMTQIIGAQSKKSIEDKILEVI